MTKKLFFIVIIFFSFSLNSKNIELYCDAEFAGNHGQKGIELLSGGMFLNLDTTNKKAIMKEIISEVSTEANILNDVIPENEYHFAIGEIDYYLNRYSGKLTVQTKNGYVQIYTGSMLETQMF